MTFERYFKVREYQNRTQHEKYAWGLILRSFSPDGKPEQLLRPPRGPPPGPPRGPVLPWGSQAVRLTAQGPKEPPHLQSRAQRNPLLYSALVVECCTEFSSIAYFIKYHHHPNSPSSKLIAYSSYHTLLRFGLTRVSSTTFYSTQTQPPVCIGRYDFPCP